MKYALLLMGNVTDADCGEDGGPDPAEFMAFDKEITDAGIVVGGVSGGVTVVHKPLHGLAHGGLADAFPCCKLSNPEPRLALEGGKRAHGNV